MVRITVFLVIELPFWLPLKSGAYRFGGGRELRLRNDFWAVFLTNVVDGPADEPFALLVNEEQVADNKLLDTYLLGRGRYYHKQKLMTVFTQTFQVTPRTGAITAQEGSSEWWRQVERVALSTVNLTMYQELLNDINLFIDTILALTGFPNALGEVRRVSFFDSGLWVLVKAVGEQKGVLHLTRIAPDFHQAGQPFPLFKVGSDAQLQELQRLLEAATKPKLHQREWAAALNRLRESRYEEALLFADIVLQTLMSSYLRRCQMRKKDADKRWGEGLANWVRGLPYPIPEHLENVARMHKVRNRVVHREQELLPADEETVRRGVGSLRELRTHLLRDINPDLLSSEQRLPGLLEPVLLEVTSPSIGQMVEVGLRWRREKDDYRPPER